MRQKTQSAVKSPKKRKRAAHIGSEPHNDAAELSLGQRLGRLGGIARARKLTAEQRREIAQKAAAKRWERSDLPQATPTAAGHDHAAALIERNRRLLSQAAGARLRRQKIAAQSEAAVGRAMASHEAVVPAAAVA
jgi:hypothetical protein